MPKPINPPGFQCLLGIVTSGLVACFSPDATQPAPGLTPPERTAYEQDVAFLRSHDPNLVVLSRGDVSVATSPKYQGKVFTSTATGAESFGYLNNDAFEAAAPDPQFNGYGGENRLWIGPEGGPLSVYFDAGVPHTGEHWYVPAEIDREPWDLVSHDSASVVFAKAGSVRNRKGTGFDFRLDRLVRLLTAEEIANDLGGSEGSRTTSLLGALNIVAYHTDNRLTNAGEEGWTREGGTLCLWALDMLPASDSAVVIYPLREQAPVERFVSYFDDMTDRHRRVVDGALLFRADGSFRSKIGLSPKHATGRGGSIDLVNNILTVIEYDLDPDAAYLGMEWEELVEPYAGDAATTYNDSSPGTFYEIESIGEAAFLGPGERASHGHTVYHLTGPQPALLEVAERLLGVSPSTVRDFLAVP